jgi:Na+/phosphate symporter
MSERRSKSDAGELVEEVDYKIDLYYEEILQAVLTRINHDTLATEAQKMKAALLSKQAELNRITDQFERARSRWKTVIEATRNKVRA